MLRGLLALFAAVSFSACATHSFVAKHEAIYDTKNGKFIKLDELAARAAAGSILVFGEEHALAAGKPTPETRIHHDNQLRLIRALQKIAPVDVGFEFLYWPKQIVLDQYLAGTLGERAFMRAADWGGANFKFYRAQILSTRGTPGRTYALNVPPAVATQVMHAGPGGLTQGNRALLPPKWRPGNAAYRARYLATMEEMKKVHPIPANAIDNSFWAQSLWDDTMAWKALQSAPDHFEVIIVGGFHVEYGGGLPFELKAMTTRPVVTILQVEADDWNPETLHKLVAPDSKYGNAADFLWLHNGSLKSKETANALAVGV